MKLVPHLFKSIIGIMVLMFSLTSSLNTQAQAVGIEVEVFQIHNGVNTGVPAGYVTYRVYATFTNPDDVLTSVYAIEGEIPMFIEADCGFWQHPLGGALAQNHQCAFYVIEPDLEYDSYFTFDWTCANQPGSTTQSVFSNPVDALTQFEAGNSITINDGAFFIPNDGSLNTIAGDDLRILIGQFTTCSEFCYSFNLQSFPNGTPGEDEFITELAGCFSNPCIPGGFIVEVTDSQNISCFGEDDGVITADQADGSLGLDPITWNLYFDGDPADSPLVAGDEDGVFEGLGSGDYLIIATDVNGCLDSTEVVTIVEPEELTLDATISQEILCAGDATGVIDLLIEGGIEPYDVSVNGASLGDITQLSNLVCGEYIIVVTDDNDCQVTADVDLACPLEFIIDVTHTDMNCFDVCDGTISADFGGGTGPLTVDVTGPDLFSFTDTGNLVSIDLTDLCEGDYTIDVVDANNCTYQEVITIDEPDEFIVTETVTMVSCFAACDGTIEFEITGGTAPYEIDADGADLEALCAGTYDISVCDDNGCCVDFSIEITEPTEIIADPVVTNVSCPGLTDASIEAPASGGVPPYSYEITGPLNVGPQDSELFTDLIGGDYVLTITDDTGCQLIIDIEIEAPEEFVLDLNPSNISCFELCDGSILGSASGGTGDLNLTITGPDGYLLEDTGNPVGIVAEDLCFGTYEVSIEDANGCSLSETIELTQPEELVVTEEHTDASCFGFCDGTITLDITGGTGPYTTDFGGFDQNALCAGMYTVEVCDNNNCCVELEIEITQPEEIVNTLDITDVTCPNLTDGALSVTTVGGVPEYTWQINGPVNQGPQDNGLFESLTGGNYNLTVEDATGCSVTQQFSIFSPDDFEVTLTVTDVTCNGFGDGTIFVDATGGTGALGYELNLEAGGPLFENLIPDDYNILITDENGCITSADTVITEPDALIAELISTMEVGCGGDCDGSAEFEVSGGIPDYTTIWNSDPLQENDELCAGANELEVTDANGCVFVLDVEILEPDPLEIIINEDPVTCTGMTDGSAAVAVTGGTGEVTLDLGELDPEDLLNLPEGEYIVTAFDETGCFTQDTIMIFAEIITDLEVDIFTSPVTCWDEGDGTATAAITGGNEPVGVVWSDPLMQTTNTAVGLEEGEYTVTITDVIGCTIDTTITIEPTEGCFFIATVLTPNSDGANDTWLIGGLEYFPDAKVQVYNRWGQLLFESTGYTVPWDGTYGGQKLPVADYYYVIEYDNSKDPLTGTVTVKY